MPRKRIRADSEKSVDIWEWKNASNDKWQTFADDAQKCISEAIQKKKTFANVSIDGVGDVKITFKKMAATVSGSKTIIEIRKVPSSTNGFPDGNKKPKLTKASAANKQSKTINSSDAASDEVSSGTKTKTKNKAKKEENVEEESNEVKISFAGKAPVDIECTEKLNKAMVFEDDGVVWDCMLNQTNIGPNNNKFYIIQLLKDNNACIYSVWLRWGRVGKRGQTMLTNFSGNIEGAKQFFCKKFSDKTSNCWYSKDSFKKVSGKYDLVLRDFSAEVEEDEKELKEPVEIPESKLDARLQSLIQLICDIKSIEAALIEMKYDPKKAPLGRLSTNQIKLGFAALKDIENIIKGTSKESLAEACSVYYTRIPHDFGMRQPPLISTLKAVENEVQLLECLQDAQAAVKKFKEKSSITNPVDRHYDQLECSLTPLEKDSELFKLLENYLQTTHADTHNLFTLEVLDIFEVNKSKEHEQFKDYGNRMLLWHGSRLMNWAGILSQGLRIAPPEAPATGYMFGKGVYFADASSKSANYCFTSNIHNTGILMLAEVSLGNTNDLLAADYNASKLPKGTNSTKGVGSMAPDRKNFITLDDGVLLPMGPLTPTDVSNPNGYTLNYNEYIVYDTKQIKMRYLFKTKFNYKF